jgi:hypothetical protein
VCDRCGVRDAYLAVAKALEGANPRCIHDVRGEPTPSNASS